MSDNKQKILDKIRTALQKKSPKPYPNLDKAKHFFEFPNEPLDLIFVQKFTALNGNFIYCEDEEDFIKNLMELSKKEKLEYIYCWESELQALFQAIDFRQCRIGTKLDKAHAGLTFCETLVARTGSIIISSGQAAGRQLAVFPPVHLVIGYLSQLVYDLDDGLAFLQQKYGAQMPSMLNVISGPSRTADIEKTLVMGAHGPKQIYLFLIDDTEETASQAMSEQNFEPYSSTDEERF